MAGSKTRHRVVAVCAERAEAALWLLSGGLAAPAARGLSEPGPSPWGLPG